MSIKFLSREEANTQEFEFNDFYLTPEYSKCVELSDCGEWELAVYMSEENFNTNNCQEDVHTSSSATILYPYVKRPIRIYGITYYDLVSPYEYSGYQMSDDISLFTIMEFRTLFLQEAKKRNYITEFIRFSPFDKSAENVSMMNEILPDHLSYLTVDVNLKSETAGVLIPENRPSETNVSDSESSESQSLRSLRYLNYLHKTRKSNRRSIKKAEQNGYTCHISPMTETDIPVFMDLYKETMDRLNANSYYYFPEEYYKSLIKNFKEDVLFVVIKKENTKEHLDDLINTIMNAEDSQFNEIVAASIYIRYGKFLHYHLGSSSTKHLQFGINNLLHTSVIKQAMTGNSNLSIIHFGGGNESLLTFKKGISNHTFYYFQGKSIINKEVYDKLVQKYETKNVGKFRSKETYFPCYRAALTELFPSK